MYIFEMEDTYMFNSIIIAVAYDFDTAREMYLISRFGEHWHTRDLSSIKLVKQYPIELGVVTWKDD